MSEGDANEMISTLDNLAHKCGCLHFNTFCYTPVPCLSDLCSLLPPLELATNHFADFI